MTDARLVRNIIERILGINAREIQLCDPESQTNMQTFVPQDNRGHSWWDGAETHTDTVYGYSLKDGITEYKNLKKDYRFSQNGTVYEESGETLSAYFERTGIAIPDFIIVKYEGKFYGENGERYSGCSISKTPDFKAHWENLNSSDVERWQNWLDANA